MGKLSGGGFDKIENPILGFVGLRRPIAKNGDGSLDIVPIHIPLVACEPMGGGFNVGDFDGHRSAQGNGLIDCCEEGFAHEDGGEFLDVMFGDGEA